MSDGQPLTCVRCWNSPASRLLVVRYRSECAHRLLCVPCAVLDEAEAPGLPSFKGVTVLTVMPAAALVTDWGVRLGPDDVVQRYSDEPDAREALRQLEALDPSRRRALVSREKWAGPWKEARGG